MPRPAFAPLSLLLAFALTVGVSQLSFAEEKEAPAAEWKSLFDGKALGDWKSVDFGGEGEVAVKEGAIQLPAGNDMTGIVWTKEFPKTNYELRWEATKVSGTDFFAAATFPVAEKHCTFVNGGWGGGLIGLSSLDGFDASENQTSGVFSFEKGKAYAFRVRVTPGRIGVWIDDKQVIDEGIEGKAIGVRWEMESCRPLGFASYATHGAVKKIEYREIKADAEKEKAGGK
jgi:hypothetical protein